MWPTFGSRITRRLNGWLLGRSLAKILRTGSAPVAIVTIVPLVADLVRRFQHLNWVYYCVDAFESWPGLDQDALRVTEVELLPMVQQIVASSQVLVERFEAWGFRAALVPHGVDLDTWHVRAGPGAGAPVASRDRPDVVFFGYIDERIDVEVCRAILEHCELCLIGPSERAPQALRQLPGLLLCPTLGQAELAQRAGQADVLVLPYRLTDATRAMQPLKLLEYLACGVPVVASPLPAVIDWTDALDVAATPADFAERVLQCAQAGLSPKQRVERERLSTMSWTSRAEDFLGLLTSRSRAATVLHVRCTDGPGGGPEKTILRSAGYLGAAGYRALAAILHDPQNNEYAQLEAWSRREGAELIPVPDNGPLDYTLVSRMSELCLREGVVIWHGHDYKSNLLGLLVARRVGVHLVSTAHGWVHRTVRTPLYFAIDRWCLRRYQRVIAVSRALGIECLAAGVSSSRLTVIENAIDASHVSPATLAPRPECLHLGAVGRLSPEKGFLDLLEAFRRLFEGGACLQLTIFGEGEQRHELEEFIHMHGLQGQVRLAGFEANKAAIFNELDIYVSSSYREGLPNALLEAMAYGLPIVSTSVGGVPDALTHGVDALLSQAGDVDALHDNLRILIRDRQLQIRFAQAARKRVLEQYSFSQRMDKMTALYDGLLGRSTGQSPASPPRRAPIRILHVFGSFRPGGVELRTVRIMEALGDGFEHTVIALDGKLTAAEWLARPGTVRFLDAPRQRRGIRPLALELRRLVDHERPNLVVSYGWGAFDVPLGLCWSSNCPVVHHEDGFTASELPRLPLRRVLARRLVLPRIAGVVVPSQRLGELARTDWHLRSDQLHIIPNGTPVHPIGHEERSLARKRFGMSDAQPVVLIAGRLAPVKAVDRAIRAAAIGGFTLLVAGDGNQGPRLRALADELGVRSTVHFLGWMTDLRPVRAATDVVLSTSLSEQHPLSVLEAMAAGLPIVSTEVGDVRIMLPSDQHEFLVAVDANPDVIARSVRRLLSSESLRQTLGASNVEQARVHFSQTDMEARYAQLYRNSSLAYSTDLRA
ncbi:MAG: glycosyltransferase involved in cell wall biosynthesis [Planctomycetota bacterium]|jgi:glycosyltransferase involved in cell wall biosynthesis